MDPFLMTLRLSAYVALLALPDDPGMHRGHVLRYSGDPRRRDRVLLPLLTRWAAYRYLDRDLADEPVTVQRPAQKFRIMRRA